MNAESLLQLLLVVLGFYILAFWMSLVIWTYRDINARTRDTYTRALAVSLVAAFNVLGLFLYFILRPKETIAEAYERALEEEALLRDLETRDACPVCRQSVHADYLLCPNCHTQLKKSCAHCHRLLELSWTLCPYCGTRAPQVSAPAALPREEIPERAPLPRPR